MIKIKDIVKWEMLTGRVFGLETEEDTIVLAYVMSETRYTLDMYKKAIADTDVGKKDYAEALKVLKEDLEYIKQFRHQDSEKNKSVEKVTYRKAVGALIFDGVNAAWLMQQGLDTLDFLLEERIHHNREKLEYSRFWSYVSLSPYLDKCKSPEAFIPFDWDKERDKTDDKVTEKDMAIAHLLFSKNKK